MISEELAKAVQDERESRAKSRRSVASNRLFSRACVCVKCGGSVNVQGTHVTSGKRMYRCRYRCLGSFVLESHLRAALEAAVRYLGEQGSIDAILGSLPDDRELIQQRLTATEAEIEKIADQRKRLSRSYSLGLLDELEYAELMRETEKQRVGVLSRVAELHVQLEHIETTHERRQRYRQLSETGRTMLDEPDINKVNAWIRRNFRLHIAGNNVQRVEYL